MFRSRFYAKIKIVVTKEFLLRLNYVKGNFRKQKKEGEGYGF